MYSQDASDRLRQIKSDSGTKVAAAITKGIRNLSDNPRKCPTIERILGIQCPYYILHIAYNYVFYRIDDQIIYVTDIYNEREDFMWKMFGISLRTQESIDFWGE